MQFRHPQGRLVPEIKRLFPQYLKTTSPSHPVGHNFYHLTKSVITPKVLRLNTSTLCMRSHASLCSRPATCHRTYRIFRPARGDVEQPRHIPRHADFVRRRVDSRQRGLDGMDRPPREMRGAKTAVRVFGKRRTLVLVTGTAFCEIPRPFGDELCAGSREVSEEIRARGGT
jgi:hypothetical protein